MTSLLEYQKNKNFDSFIHMLYREIESRLDGETIIRSYYDPNQEEYNVPLNSSPETSDLYWDDIAVVDAKYEVLGDEHSVDGKKYTILLCQNLQDDYILDFTYSSWGDSSFELFEAEEIYPMIYKRHGRAIKYPAILES